MSIKDKALEKQLLASMNRLEELNDRVGPTPLRHRINEMVVSARRALREFDQGKYEADENWTAPPAWSTNPATAAASLIPNADPEIVAQAEAYCNERVRVEAFPELGMTLRDHFAGRALQGMLSSPPVVDRAGVEKPVWANHAYAWADAMLEARERVRDADHVL